MIEVSCCCCLILGFDCGYSSRISSRLVCATGTRPVLIACPIRSPSARSLQTPAFPITSRCLDGSTRWATAGVLFWEDVPWCARLHQKTHTRILPHFKNRKPSHKKGGTMTQPVFPISSPILASDFGSESASAGMVCPWLGGSSQLVPSRKANSRRLFHQQVTG